MPDPRLPKAKPANRSQVEPLWRVKRHVVDPERLKDTARTTEKRRSGRLLRRQTQAS